MQSEWILDVLADLRTFAMSNGLPALAEQLDDSAIIAMAEIASQQEGPTGQLNGERSRNGGNPSRAGTSRHA